MAASDPSRSHGSIPSRQPPLHAQTSSDKGVCDGVLLAATWVFHPGITWHLVSALPSSQKCSSPLPVSLPQKSSPPYNCTLCETVVVTKMTALNITNSATLYLHG